MNRIATGALGPPAGPAPSLDDLLNADWFQYSLLNPDYVKVFGLATQHLMSPPEETNDLDSSANCAGNCVLSEKSESQKGRDKREEEKISELDKRSVQKPGDKPFNRDIPGTWDDANSDFDDFAPDSVEPMGSGGRFGTLSDGRRINVRPNSGEGVPTLEIQRPDGKRPIRKYRYQ
ncbi:hypothetical protein [Fulvimarina sp. MAC8]|uniref:hypothetical protein n=1 Tax=Fulvimarina sp. MAC8 TaxID=3162874 RepID=UPI0032EBFAED